MAQFRYNLPNGKVASFSQEATPEQLRQAMALTGGVGELRRREGEGEIAATAPPPTFSEFGQRIGNIVSGRGLSEFEQERIPQDAFAPEAERAVRAGAPLAAAVIAPQLLPARLLSGGGTLANLARAGLESMLASTAAVGTEKAFDVAEGKPVGEAAAESVLPIAVGTALGPPAAWLTKVGLNAGIRGLSALSKLKGGVSAFIADLARPIELTPTQVSGMKARDVIETASGVRIPVGLAEAIRSNPASRRMLLPGVEVSAEELKPLEDLVFRTVANTGFSGRSTSEISSAVFDVLDPQRTGLNDAVKAAVENFTRKAIGTVNATEASMRGAGRFMFPAGRSADAIFNEGKDLAVSAMKSAQSDWNAVFSSMRSMPEIPQVKVDFRPLKQLAEDQELELVPSAGGKISVLANTGARKTIEGAEGVADFATFEQAKNLISELGEGLGRGDILPGVDVRIKAQLAETAKNQLESALAPFPALQAASAAANKLYAENIGRFKGTFAEGILRPIGEKGGTLPETIAASLTGENAKSNLDMFLDLLGKGKTAGTDMSAQGLNLVREAVVANAAEAGRKGGGINVGKLFDTVDSLSPAVKLQLFPNYKQLVDLFQKSEALKGSGIAGKSAKEILDQINIDPATIQKALSTGDFTGLKQASELSIRQEQAARQTLSKLGLDKLMERDAFDIKEFIKDPNNLPRLSNLGSKLQSNPTLHGEVKALFLDELMSKATEGGRFSPDKFKELIGLAQATAPGVAGRQSGTYSDAARVVLGGGERKALEEMAEAIGKIPTQETVQIEAGKTWFNRLVFGYSGGNALQGTGNSIVNFVGRLLAEIPEIRYAVASKFLTTQELRKAAMQPMERLRARDIRAAISGASALLAEKYGPESEIYRQARLLEDSIPQ